jgi:hypothetical protein
LLPKHDLMVESLLLKRMKWRTNLVRKTLPLPWLHPLRTAPFYLAKKETNTAPIRRPRYQFVRAATSPPSSAPPSSAADFPKSAVLVVHTTTLSLFSVAPPSSVPPRRPCYLGRPWTARSSCRPHRCAAPIVCGAPVVRAAAPPSLSGPSPAS